ncbi:type II toxin-antitoxin system RelE/ParE family toxin [Enterococcus hulanensis]|uniref:type II toxin-antitoxin system RelE family toxin n=1 Tax=Enterococcus hulanensis TaxID=2559929 RepID=UPI0028916AC7|nr:type II toxin-antitoxin system RelE/ParE family toxin [Enterococcus hulanensis]MDT2661660.1 type II toxin-antitoxin system RelE/ParE family toxin [Enterococcus hulanensis]
MTKHYLVRYEKAAQKALKEMDRFQASMIISWIEKNLVGTDNLRQHGKGIVENRSGEWRYRIGDYRLIANINDESVTILIIQIAHRNTIYK